MNGDSGCALRRLGYYIVSLPRGAFWFCELLHCFLHEPHSSRGSREGKMPEVLNSQNIKHRGRPNTRKKPLLPALSLRDQPAEELVRRHEAHDHQRNVPHVRDQPSESPAVRLTARVPVDVEELAQGPDAQEKRGGFRENHAIDGGEELAHREPLERLLVCPLNAVELYVVSIRRLGVQLRVIDVVPFARQAHLRVEEIRRLLEIAFSRSRLGASECGIAP